MTERIQVTKTHKLFINGAFPRSESGRSAVVIDAKGKVAAHLCRASRKDVRDAVTAAAKAQPSWAERAAYNRSQILYRMGEMLEGKSDEFIQVIKQTTNADLRAARKQVAASIDRLVAFAGWADKFSQVLGCHNPIAGPYYNFTVPEATGVVAVIGPDEPSLLGLVSLIAPAALRRQHHRRTRLPRRAHHRLLIGRSLRHERCPRRRHQHPHRRPRRTHRLDRRPSRSRRDPCRGPERRRNQVRPTRLRPTT